jgi:hypothetical protein
MQGLNFLLSQQGSGTVKGLYITPITIKKYFKSAGQNHLDESLLGKGTNCDYFSSFTAMESHTLFFYVASKTRQNVCHIKGGVCDIFKAISQQLSRSQHPA